MSVLLAFTLEHAARVTGVSERRIRYWDRTEVLRPSLGDDRARGGAYGRIYSFRGLVGLRTLGQLRDRFGFSLQKLRLVGDWLAQHYEAPWATLRFYVQGADVLFGDPDLAAIISTERRGQAIIPFRLEDIARETGVEAAKLAQRRPDEIGRITRNRYVMSNAPVIAGTRIPTAAIWDFHRAGYSAAQIMDEYPRLRDADIDRAIAFERERRAEAIAV